MLNCKQVSQLVSESLDRKLSLPERMGLWMHLMMCGLCSQFRRVILRVQEEVQSNAAELETGDITDDVRLSDVSRQRIKQLLDARES